jgi:hypothetical protein
MQVKTCDRSQSRYPTDTIQEKSKKKVERTACIPVKDLRLICYQQKEFLDPMPSATTLTDDHGITHGSTLDLAPMQIHVKTPEETIIPGTVKPTDVIHDVKKSVRSQAGIPVEDQRIGRAFCYSAIHKRNKISFFSN